MTTPSAPSNVLMARPPLLSQEGTLTLLKLNPTRQAVFMLAHAAVIICTSDFNFPEG